MKVVKNKKVKKPQINQEKVAKLREEFDLMNQQLQSKEYTFYLNKEQTDYLMNVFYNEVEWKGYESYAIYETHNVISKQIKKGEINGKAKPEIIEAIFHFLKNYTSKGYHNALNHKSLCDVFALSITEINNDRQKLRDISLELVSEEQGIPIEELIKKSNSDDKMINKS